MIAPNNNRTLTDVEVECPNCPGDGWTHIRRAYTAVGSDPHEAVVYNGTFAGDSTESRRSALVIEFWCETCGKRFRWVLQQHKGKNYFYSQMVETEKCDDCGLVVGDEYGREREPGQCKCITGRVE